MSGYKYIQITDVQWNDVQSRLTTARRENEENKRALEEERRRSQERMQSLTQSSQREIASLNERFAQQLQQQGTSLQQEMNNRLLQQRRSFDQEMSRRLARQSAELISEFHQEIDGVKQSLGQAIADIQSEMERQSRSREEIAEFWLTEYQSLVNGIKRERIHYDHYQPGQMAVFETQIGIAQGLLSSDPSAATAHIASQFANLTQFRNELIIYENECVGLYNSAQETVLRLLGKVQADMEANYLLDGKTVPANMDYWTDRKFSGALQNLTHIQNELQKPEELRLEDLQNINRTLLELQGVLPQLEEEARTRFSASEARIRTMENVAEALSEHGWQLEAGIYVDGDEKSDIRGHFINTTEQDEIVVTIGDHRVDIDQFISSTNNEDIVSANSQVIGECLEAAGLCDGDIVRPITAPGYERSPNGRRNVLDSFKKNNN